MIPTEYYRCKLENAQIYQDWLMVELAKRGMIIQVFGSKEYQYKCGESFSRDEIKFDERQLTTNNLAIEEYEKTNRNNPYFVKAGINREGIIRWLQGNYQTLWVFEFNKLREYVITGAKRHNNPLRRYAIDTSKGILLPCSEADKIATLKIRFNEKDFTKSVQIVRPVEVPYLEKEPRKEKSLFHFGGFS